MIEHVQRSARRQTVRGARVFISLVAVCLFFGLLQPVFTSAHGRSEQFAKETSQQQKVHAAAATPGDLDATFGTGGKVTTDFAGNRDQGFALALQSDGKIVVAGTAIINEAQQADFALSRYNANGTLDTSFGTGGKVTTDFGGNDQAVAVAIQSDGKIVVAGGTCSDSGRGCTTFADGGFDFLVARYNANGTLDTTFGSGGRVITDFNGGIDVATSLVIQSDGRIVVGGTACQNNNGQCVFTSGFDNGVQFALARYMPNGSLDTTFGTGGKVNTKVLLFGSIVALALQSDGKILAGGLAFLPRGDSDFMLVRYQANGSLDTTFGTGGMVNVDFNTDSSGDGREDAITALAIQPDGKIVAAGASESAPIPHFFDFAVARFNPNGSLDASFGSGGKVTTDLAGNSNQAGSGGSDQAGSVMIQPDGKILVGGVAGGEVYMSATSSTALVVNDSAEAPGADFGLVRYNTNGTLDTTFGRNSIVRTDFFGASDAGRFLLQPDGRVVAAGFARRSFTAPSKQQRPATLAGRALYMWMSALTDAQADADFALARYEANAVNVNAPTITGISPNSGSTNGGTSVTITGTKFATGATVTIGGVAATNVVRVSDTQITATTPAHAAGAVSVTVTNANGDSGVLPLGFTYIAPPVPVIISVTRQGKNLVVVGQNFDSGSAIFLNGERRKTIHDDQDPTTLVGKKVGKVVQPGDKVKVRNSDGTESVEVTYNPTQ